MSTLAAVAVDVGGSGLRLAVRRTDGSVTAPRTAAGVRVGGTGIDVGALVADARTLLDAEAPGDDAPHVVVWSMRGLLFLADRAAVLDAVSAGLRGRRTVVVSDAVANLVGATGDLGPGAVVAAGTGAVAFGTDWGRQWRRVDGWGHVLGDAGSAAVLGLGGLRAALRAHDGLDGGSAGLLDAATHLLGAPETWPRQVMTGPDAPERLASVAPLVTAAAADDPVAAALCAEAGRGLAASLLRAADGITDPTLVATGGLLAAAPVAAALDAALASRGRRREEARGGALDGALVLADRLLSMGTVPEHPTYLLVGPPQP